MGSKLNKVYMALKAVNGSFVELRINKTLVIMWHQNKKKLLVYVTEYKTCNKKQDSFVIHWQKVSIWSLTWAVKLLYKKTWRRRKYMYWNAVYATKDDMGGFIFLVTLFSIKKEWEKLWESFIFLFYFMWLPYEKIISLKEAGKLIWYKYLNTPIYSTVLSLPCKRTCYNMKVWTWFWIT